MLRIGQDYTKAEAERFAQQGYDKQNADVSSDCQDFDDTQDAMMTTMQPMCGAHPWLRDKNYEPAAEEAKEGNKGY